MIVVALLLLLVLFCGGFGLYWLSKSIKNQAKKRITSTAVLLITVPKEEQRKNDEIIEPVGRDFKEDMAPAEQLFAALHSLHNSSFLNYWTDEQEILSFEIVAEQNVISFYVTCVRKLVPVIERQVHAIYPHATIELVPHYQLFSMENGFVSAAVLKEEKRYIYPIRTYQYLEADPLNALTNAMSKLGPNSSAAIQVLVKPIADRWRYQTANAAKQVLEGKSNYMYKSGLERGFHSTINGIGQGIGQASVKDKHTTSDSKPFRHTPGQEELMKAFNEKGNRPGYRTIIRILSVAEDQATADVVRDSIAAAFGQYDAPAWNSFKTIKASNPLTIATDFLLRSFNRAPQMILNTDELASIFHLPNRYTETPHIKWLKSKTLPAPANLPAEGITIGESVYRGQIKPIKMKDDDRRRHVFMIGKTGVGKTTLFENMIDQDIRAGKGVCFIDPLGDAIESILQKIPKERAQDVILFDPSNTARPMGLNLLEWKRPEEKDFLIAEWIEIFYKLFDPNRTGIIGPQWEHWGRNAALTIMGLPEGGSLIEIPRLFTDDAFRTRAVASVTDPVVKAFWDQQLAKTADFHKSEMYNYFISKFGRFMTNDLMRNIIGQTKSAFDIREVMDSGKILLINLAKGKIGEMNSNLLGLILVSKIQTAAFSRADIAEDTRKDFYLYVDEFQNFTTDTFGTILSEARKYRLNLNITNQYIAQLPEKIRDAVIGNAGTMIVYRIGAADAEFMAKEFPGVAIDDMVNLDKYTTYAKLLIDLTPSVPFSMRGIKSPIQKDPQMGEAIRQLSSQSYGVDKTVLDAEFAARLQSVSATPSMGETTKGLIGS